MDSFAPTQQLAGGTILAATDNTLATSEVRGCAIARTGAGVYTITKAPGLPGQSIWPVAKELIVKTQSRTALSSISVARTSDTVLTVSCVTIAAGNAALETDLSFSVEQLITAT